MVAMVASISSTPMIFLRLLLRQQHQGRPRLINHVNRLVWQFAVAHVAGRQLHSSFNGFVRVLNFMVFFVIGLEAFREWQSHPAMKVR